MGQGVGVSGRGAEEGGEREGEGGGESRGEGVIGCLGVGRINGEYEMKWVEIF